MDGGLRYCVVALLPGGTRVRESASESERDTERKRDREGEGRKRWRGGPSSIARGPRWRTPEPCPRVTVSADPVSTPQGVILV